MATIVLGAGTPHTPLHPKQVLEQGPTSETGALYRKVAAEIERDRPDLIVFFDSDHFVNFFFNNLPTFCIGITDQANGPESRVEMPRYRVPIQEGFARALFEYAVGQQFDVASAEELTLDHSILVPLHFLTPKMDVPIVPVFIRGLATPLPLARRCLALGRMVRQFIRDWPGSERVALLASGSFSLEVGGPRFDHLDRAWLATILPLLKAGQAEALAEIATTDRMLEAGNVGGELLNWIAMLGALGPSRPRLLEPQEGHAFAVWEPA